MLRLTRLQFACCVSASLLIGCARWSNETPVDAPRVLPPLKRNLDTVVVETVFVRFAESKLSELDLIWDKADATVLDIELRRKLDANGLRVGVLIGDLPELLMQQMKATSEAQATDAMEHAGLAADVDNRMRQLQCRAGRRKELFVRKQVNDSITVLSKLNGELSGETFDAPSLLFDLRTMPISGQRASVSLVPEVQYGAMQQNFISNEYGVRPEYRRPRKTWPELGIDIELEAGRVLLVSATYPPKALGQAFFTTKTAEKATEHVVMLLRVSESAINELFEPEKAAQATAMMER
ncbi:MAG: hypothetical protein AAGG44_15905 [Planctomycetota bacterium]